MIPTGRSWIHEIKHDGYRLLVRRAGEIAQVITRGGYDWTARYPAIAAAALRLPINSFVLDREGVVEGEGGGGDLKMLQSRKNDRHCHLVAFDLLQLGGRDLQLLPLAERKGLLAKLLADSAAGIVYADHLEGGEGVPMFEAACRMGLEGNPDPWKARLEEAI